MLKKKHLLLMSSLAIVLGCGVGLTACGEEDGVPTPEASYDIPEDSYPLSPGKTVASILFDVAGEGLAGGLKGGVHQAVVSIGEWAAKGICESLKEAFVNDKKNYMQEVSDRLSNIEGEILKLADKVDWIKDKVDDAAYLNSYLHFIEKFTDTSKIVSDRWQHYAEIENAIALTGKNKPSEETIEMMFDTLCSEIRNGQTGTNELDILADSLGKALLGDYNGSIVIGNHSIFHIIERFVNKLTPFMDNRYKEIVEISADFYTTFYQASYLATLEYIRKLQSNGIVEYVMDENSKIFAYKGSNTGGQLEWYANIDPISTRYEKALEKVKGPLKDDLKNAEYLPMNVYRKGACAQYDNRITNTVTFYNNVTKKYKELLKKYDIPKGERHLMYEDGSLQKTQLHIKTVQPKNFLSWDPKTDKWTVNYSNFGNIGKAEFEKYANTIRKHATVIDDRERKVYLTFRQFFEKEGYVFSESNYSYFLLLGADRNGYKDYSDLFNNAYAYKNTFSVYTIELDKKVEDFCKNPTYFKFTYGTYIEKVREEGSECAVAFDYPEYAFESRGTSGKGEIHVGFKKTKTFEGDWETRKPTTFATIFNLSTNPRSGVVGQDSTSF